MTYNILIKASGANADTFKFYQENGTTYETDDISKLTTMYNTLLEKYPRTQVLPIHKLDVELNTEITGCGF